MIEQKHWYKLETESDYKKAFKRFNEIIDAKRGSRFYKERMLLSLLIQQYEESKWDLPEVDPIELIKIRMEDFGYKPAIWEHIYLTSLWNILKANT